MIDLVKTLDHVTSSVIGTLAEAGEIAKPCTKKSQWGQKLMHYWHRGQKLVLLWGGGQKLLVLWGQKLIGGFVFLVLGLGAGN